MKLTAITAIALLSGVAVARSQECTEGTATVTVTVTKQAVGGGGGGGGYKTITITAEAPAGGYAPPAQTVYVTAAGASGDSRGSEFNYADGGSNGGPVDSNGAQWNSNTQSGGSSGSDTNSVSGSDASAVGKSAGTVTSHDVSEDGTQTVVECPTKIEGSSECYKAVYGSDSKLITAVAMSLSVETVFGGEVVTKTITVTGPPRTTPTLDVASPQGKADAGDSEPIVTQIVDVTTYTTKQGKTVYKTNTHWSTIIATGTGSASNAAPTHFVSVGKDGKKAFEPSNIKAKAGDTVRFTFFPRNHSVTTCSFDNPCVSDGQYDSGFKFTFIKNSTTFVDFPITDDSKPLMFFSKHERECKDGMVFGVNTDKFDQFQKNAKNFDAKSLNSTLANNGTLNGTVSNSWSSSQWRNDTKSTWNNSTTPSDTTQATNTTGIFNSTQYQPIHHHDVYNSTHHNTTHSNSTNDTTHSDYEIKQNRVSDKTSYGGRKRHLPVRLYGRDDLP